MIRQGRLLWIGSIVCCSDKVNCAFFGISSTTKKNLNYKLRVYVKFQSRVKMIYMYVMNNKIWGAWKETSGSKWQEEHQSLQTDNKLITNRNLGWRLVEAMFWSPEHTVFAMSGFNEVCGYAFCSTESPFEWLQKLKSTLVHTIMERLVWLGISGRLHLFIYCRHTVRTRSNWSWWRKKNCRFNCVFIKQDLIWISNYTKNHWMCVCVENAFLLLRCRFPQMLIQDE